MVVYQRRPMCPGTRAAMQPWLALLERCLTAAGGLDGIYASEERGGVIVIGRSEWCRMT